MPKDQIARPPDPLLGLFTVKRIVIGLVLIVAIIAVYTVLDDNFATQDAATPTARGQRFR